ncbi:MAG: Spy/CpxP family protein refolding chaperone [Bryobacteraceae bacterium]
MKNCNLLRCAGGALILTGLMFAQAPPPAGPPGGGPGMPGPRARAAHRFERLAAVLNLTEDQKTQIRSIVRQSAEQAKPVHVQVRDNHKAIEQLVHSAAAGPDFDKQLQDLANTQGSLTAQLAVIHAKAQSQIWALLTPEQHQKAEIVRQLLGPGPDGLMWGARGGGGAGRGMGMGRGMGPHMPPGPAQ